MSPKSLRLAYWTATLIFALLLVLDGIGGLMQAEAGQEALLHLGYPLYLLPFFGIAKLLAAVACRTFSGVRRNATGSLHDARCN